MYPDYAGGSVVNLAAELERRLIGSAPTVSLHPELAAAIPEADGYVVVLCDGLGDAQLAHPHAAGLRRYRRARLDAAFPTTTTTNLASIATGLPPSQHGLLGYQLWLPDAGVVNTIKWTTLWGEPVDHDYERFLPAPNLWERLAAGGVEAVTVQPANFSGSPLSRLLYRGCRWESAYTLTELVEATAGLAKPGRIVFTYVPHVDVAAHVQGQTAPEYAEAMSAVATIWEHIVAALPAGIVAVGVADHGHVDFPADRQAQIADADHDGRDFYGDMRVTFVRGDGASLAPRLPATWVPIDEMRDWWGPPPLHPDFAERCPDGALVANEGWVLLHRRSDTRLIGNHGGLTDAERLVPLLVASG